MSRQASIPDPKEVTGYLIINNMIKKSFSGEILGIKSLNRNKSKWYIIREYRYTTQTYL